MNYRVFDEMGELPKGDKERQRHMEEWMQKAFSGTVPKQDGRIYEQMNAEFRSCDPKERMLQVEFPVKDWMLNPNDNMHGGMIATSMDMTCGLLTRYMIASGKTSTVELNINYLSSLHRDESYIVCAKVKRLGRKMIFLTAEASSREDGRLVAMGTGIFVR